MKFTEDKLIGKNCTDESLKIFIKLASFIGQLDSQIDTGDAERNKLLSKNSLILIDGIRSDVSFLIKTFKNLKVYQF